MMISVYLVESVLATQSSTNIIDLKIKNDKCKNFFYEIRMCFVFLTSRKTIVEFVSK